HRGFWAVLEWELEGQVRLLEGVPLEGEDATLQAELRVALERVRAIRIWNQQQRPGQQGGSAAVLGGQPVPPPQASEPSEADMDALVALAGRARRALSSAGQGSQRGRGGGASGAAAGEGEGIEGSGSGGAGSQCGGTAEGGSEGERDDGNGIVYGMGNDIVYGMLTSYATTPGARRALVAGGLCVPALLSLQPLARAWGSFPPELLQVDWLAGAASAAEAELWLAVIEYTGTEANLQQARKQLERAATVLLCVRNVIRRHHESGPRAAILNLLNLIPARLLGRSSSSPPPPALSITGIAGWVTNGDDANPPRAVELVPACGAPAAMHFRQVLAAGGGGLISRRGRG
ncbi:hypothetical protein HYH03_003532, partial [Edaphochlamys debaryana]